MRGGNTQFTWLPGQTCYNTNNLNNPLINNLPVNLPPKHNHYGITEAGTNSNYIDMSVSLQDENPISNGLIVALPDNTTMQATHSGTLNIPELLLKAKIVYKF